MFAATLAAPNIWPASHRAWDFRGDADKLLRPPSGGDRPRLRLESLAGDRRAGGTPAAVIDRLPPRYEFGPLPSSGQVRFAWSLPHQHPGGVRDDDPRGATALGESHQGLRRQSRLSIICVSPGSDRRRPCL
jgi:hypothetical protein